VYSVLASDLGMYWYLRSGLLLACLLVLMASFMASSWLPGRCEASVVMFSFGYSFIGGASGIGWYGFGLKSDAVKRGGPRR